MDQNTLKCTALSAPYNNNKILSYCCVDHTENVINELVYASAGAYGKAGIRNPESGTGAGNGNGTGPGT